MFSLFGLQKYEGWGVLNTARSPRRVNDAYWSECKCLRHKTAHVHCSLERQQIDVRRGELQVKSQVSKTGGLSLHPLPRWSFLQSFLLCVDDQLIGWGPLRVGGEYALLSPQIQMLTLIKTPHKHSQQNVWPNTWWTHGPTKLI